MNRPAPLQRVPPSFQPARLDHGLHPLPSSCFFLAALTCSCHSNPPQLKCPRRGSILHCATSCNPCRSPYSHLDFAPPITALRCPCILPQSHGHRPPPSFPLHGPSLHPLSTPNRRPATPPPLLPLSAAQGSNLPANLAPSPLPIAPSAPTGSLFLLFLLPLPMPPRLLQNLFLVMLMPLLYISNPHPLTI